MKFTAATAVLLAGLAAAKPVNPRSHQTTSVDSCSATATVTVTVGSDASVATVKADKASSSSSTKTSKSTKTTKTSKTTAATTATGSASAEATSTKTSTKKSSSSTSKASSAAAAASTGATSTSSSGSSDSSSSSGASETCSIGYCTQNGGTTGGSAGTTVTVTDLDSLKTNAESDGAMMIIVSGAITGSDKIRVASDKTIYGESGSSVEGVGFYIKDVSNVIIRNMKISKVLADNGDAIGIQASTNVWVDHCDLSSDMDNGKDYYDGLMDITHAAEWVTVSNTYLHDHYKASLVGHSDSNADEDTGHLHVTYANNYWQNLSSRQPSVRFGTVHVVNNYWEGATTTGVNTRMGAEVFVQSSAFVDCATEAITAKYSDEVGYATVDDVDLGGSTNDADAGTLTASSLPYDAITVLGSDTIASTIPSTAGQTL